MAETGAKKEKADIPYRDVVVLKAEAYDLLAQMERYELLKNEIRQQLQATNQEIAEAVQREREKT